MPERIQMTRQRPWRALHPNAVRIDRTTKYGNPFRLRSESHGLVRYRPETPDVIDYEGRISHDGNRHDWYGPDGTVTVHYVRYATVEELVWLFERTLLDPTPSMRMAYPSGSGRFAKVTVEEVRAELAGCDVACWCPLDAPCHGDVLLRLANEPLERQAA